MIDKIDIEQFGSYSGFKHDQNIDSVYKKLNICYGKNYSGKSTFSKIFQAFELAELPDNYGSIKFSIKLTTGETITEKSVSDKVINARVFNSDYIRRNLNFFGEDGINTFALLGDGNIKIEEELNKLEEENRKLTLSDKMNFEEFQLADKEFQSFKGDWEKTKTEIASKIKRNNNLFIGNYDKRNLTAEIDQAMSSKDIAEAQKNEHKKSIVEDKMESVLKQNLPNIDFENLLEQTNLLISKIVKPSAIIETLESDPRKQQWVKEGLHLHTENNGSEDKCIFCDSPITNARYELLDKFFSKEVLYFEEELISFLKKIEEIKNNIDSIEKIKKDTFYIQYQNDIEELNKSIEFEKKTELLFLDSLITVVEKKLKSMFTVFSELKSVVPLGYYSEEVSISNQYELLYEANNLLSGELEKNKENSRYALRMDFIKNTLIEIEYLKIQSDLSIKERASSEKYMTYHNTHQLLLDNIKSMEEVRLQLSNEKIAATQINSYLNNYLGHEELHLGVSEEDKQSSFVVKRKKDTAYNLSEGEMSLISFAYFLASLKELSDIERQSTIVFVDDPISSLDENNIFYIFSLLQSEVIDKDYGQIFITTHNLDFLKYVTKYKINNKQRKYLMVDKHRSVGGNGLSIIQNMPKHMTSKVTEFNFLFEQIYTVATEKQSDDNYHVFYSFPNNARKFLETLLYFKYPSYKDPGNDSSWRFKDFFGEGVNDTFINRINNEYSHGLDRFDRLSKQINSAEFFKDAILILQTIKEKDIKQYMSLLDNSNLPDKEWYSEPNTV